MLDPVHNGLLIFLPACLPALRAFLATSKGPGHPDTPIEWREAGHFGQPRYLRRYPLLNRSLIMVKNFVCCSGVSTSLCATM